MARDSYWYPRAADSSSTPQMIALLTMHGKAGYGSFVLLEEFLRRQENYRFDYSSKFSLSTLAEVLKFSAEDCKKFIADCIEYEAIHTDGTFIWSQVLCDAMAPWDEKKRVLSERGKKGAQATNSKKSAQAKEFHATSEEIGHLPAKSDQQEENNKNNNESRVSDTHTQSNISFKNFNDWVSTNAPGVLKMKEPFSSEQFSEISNQHSREIIKKTIEYMGNRADLQSFVSAFTTFKRFVIHEYRVEKNLLITGESDINKKLKEAVRGYSG